MLQSGLGRHSLWEPACSGCFRAVAVVAGVTESRVMATSVVLEAISTIVSEAPCHHPREDLGMDNLPPRDTKSRARITWAQWVVRGRPRMNHSDMFERMLYVLR